MMLVDQTGLRIRSTIMNHPASQWRRPPGHASCLPGRDTRSSQGEAYESAGGNDGEEQPEVCRRADADARRRTGSPSQEDGCVLARRELPGGRPDLPDGESAASRAAQTRARETAAAGTLGYDTRPELHLRAPESNHPRARCG